MTIDELVWTVDPQNKLGDSWARVKLSTNRYLEIVRLPREKIIYRFFLSKRAKFSWYEDDELLCEFSNESDDTFTLQCMLTEYTKDKDKA